MANGDVTIDMEVESISDEEFLNNWAAKTRSVAMWWTNCGRKVLRRWTH